MTREPYVLDNQREHEACGCDGCAEALPVPVENERSERRRERLDGEEGAAEEGEFAGAALELGTQAAGEAGVGGMKVEHAQRVGTRIGEPVPGARRRREKRPRAGALYVVADDEVHLALENEKGVDKVVMRMRVDALEFGLEGHFEDRQLGQFGLDQVGGRFAPDALAFTCAPEDRIPEASPPVGGRVELVEVLAAATSQDIGETHARRMDVQEDGGRAARVPEGVHDVRRRQGERSWSADQSRDVRPEPEVDLALENVEPVGVLPVNMGLGAFLARFVAEPRHDQLFEVAEDSQRPFGPVGSRLAFAGS